MLSVSIDAQRESTTSYPLRITKPESPSDSPGFWLEHGASISTLSKRREGNIGPFAWFSTSSPSQLRLRRNSLFHRCSWRDPLETPWRVVPSILHIASQPLRVISGIRRIGCGLPIRCYSSHRSSGGEFVLLRFPLRSIYAQQRCRRPYLHSRV